MTHMPYETRFKREQRKEIAPDVIQQRQPRQSTGMTISI
jgi:hypothetical protein